MISNGALAAVISLAGFFFVNENDDTSTAYRMYKAVFQFFAVMYKIITIAKSKATPANVKYAPAKLRPRKSGNVPDPAFPEVSVKPGDKVMWGYWHSGRATMPGFCEYCVQTWEARNPSWTVIILDEENMGNYVNADELPSTFNSLKVQHRSDIVRVAVLLRYGGIYLDVSTVCMKGFDDIFEKPEGGPNLLITAPVYGTFKADPTLALPNNAFLVAREPGDLVLAEWHQRMLKYLEAPCASLEDMEKHAAFKRVAHLFRDPGLGVIADSMPYVAVLSLLWDLIAFDDEWASKVQSGVQILPTGAWTFEYFVCVGPTSDGKFHWTLGDLCTRNARFSWVRWGDDPAKAKAICESAMIIKSSSDANTELKMPAEWFKKTHPSTTLERVWKAAVDPASGQPQATLAGAIQVPRGKSA